VVGGKDIEIDRAVRREDFLSGACFGSTSCSVLGRSPPLRQTALAKQFVPPMPNRLSTSRSSLHMPEGRTTDVQAVDVTETYSVQKSTSRPKVNASYWEANW
jgi:DNA repair and recombination protein RAD54B